jgi:hypothetical protein
MDSFMYEKEKSSITTFGFVVPIIANTSGVIIDGEHRWKVAKDLGYTEVPAIYLDIDDTTAKQLTIVLNETHGEADPDRLADLVRDLAGRMDKTRLADVLPFSHERMATLLGDFHWDAFDEPRKKEEKKEEWVLRSFRMPADAAQVLDDAIRRIQASERCPDWSALEMICAEYLGGQ